MNVLPREKQIAVIRALVEGNSIRSTCRLTGVAKGTVMRLLVDVGKACEEYHKKNVMGIQTKFIQCDEVWAFCYAKQKNVPSKYKDIFGYGDVWTFTAIDKETKMCISYFVGERTTEHAIAFMLDLRKRVVGRVQITTDAFKGYEFAIQTFQNEVDYATLTKIYGPSWYAPQNAPYRKYSPNICNAVKKQTRIGIPLNSEICTSHVERQNLTMRMQMRRFTRLTNGFSKKVDNLKAAISLHFMYYNYCRIHQSLRVTPAMASKLSDRLWDISDLLDLNNIKKIAA